MTKCSGKKDTRNRVRDNSDVKTADNVFRENITNIFKDLNENLVKLTEYKCRKSTAKKPM